MKSWALLQRRLGLEKYLHETEEERLVSLPLGVSQARLFENGEIT